jgi:hypothetical protein
MWPQSQHFLITFYLKAHLVGGAWNTAIIETNKTKTLIAVTTLLFLTMTLQQTKPFKQDLKGNHKHH